MEILYQVYKIKVIGVSYAEVCGVTSYIVIPDVGVEIVDSCIVGGAAVVMMSEPTGVACVGDPIGDIGSP
jgi:hypothetical protein